MSQNIGANSTAQGSGTIAAAKDQVVLGSFNIPDFSISKNPNDKSSYAFIIGNGDNNNTRSNALSVDWKGNALFAGDVYTNNNRKPQNKLIASYERPFSLNNVVCIGDSFLDGSTDEEEYVSGHGWGWWLYQMQFQNNPNTKFQIAPEGGAGFTQKGKVEHNFIDLIELKAGEMNEQEKADVETVIIIGGINDALNEYTVDYHETVEKAKDTFPNAKIVVAMSPMCSRYFRVAEDFPDNIAMKHPASYYFIKLRQPSNDPRVCILTDSHQWLLCDASMRCRDGLHPNHAGYQRIAEHLFNASFGLTLDTYYEGPLEFVKSKNYPSELQINFSKIGNIINLRVEGTVSNTSSEDERIVLGSRPPWMNQTFDAVVPIRSNIPNTALYFNGYAMSLLIPCNTTAYFNGNTTIGIDML